MILFDQLKISDDGSKMYINAHVNNADYYNDVYIDSITIMISDKISETAPGVPTSDYIYTQQIEGNTKEINLVLSALDFSKTWEKDPKSIPFKQGDMSNTLFFIYIKCKGTPSDTTPCTLDNEYTLGVIFDENVLHQKIMNFTKVLIDDCNIPIEFVDFILLWNAFKASIETEHYIPAIKFFNLLFTNNIKNNGNIKRCGCHG